MKKILAIAVSLVMVFAVAVSASALFGFKPGTTPVKVDGFKVDVTLYDRGTTGAGNSMITGTYPVHAPTSGVRAGEVYAFAVDVTMPAYNGLTVTGQTLVNTPTTGLRVTTSNLTGFAPTTASSRTAALVAPAYGAGMTANTWGALPVNGTLSISLAELNALADGIGGTDVVPDTAGDPEAEFVFSAECAIRTLADASVSAVFGAPDPDVRHFDSVSGGARSADITEATCVVGNWGVEFDTATRTYYMREIGSVGGVAQYTGNELVFTVNPPDNAGNMTVADTYVDPNSAGSGIAVHRVAKDPTTGEIIFISTADSKRNVNASETAVINAVLTRAFTAMGFTWTPGGVLYDAGFEAIAARGLQFGDSAIFYAYTASLTVPGTGTNAVPDTGDGSIAGIVLMAAAVLMAAVVVIGKVRA